MPTRTVSGFTLRSRGRAAMACLLVNNRGKKEKNDDLEEVVEQPNKGRHNHENNVGPVPELVVPAKRADERSSKQNCL